MSFSNILPWWVLDLDAAIVSFNKGEITKEQFIKFLEEHKGIPGVVVENWKEKLNAKV